MINKILHDYYYGQNCPVEKRFDKESEYAKTLSEITKRQEAFLEKLSAEDRSTLEEIFSLQGTLSSITGETAFIEGMKHGFQLALILMESEPEDS